MIAGFPFSASVAGLSSLAHLSGFQRGYFMEWFGRVAAVFRTLPLT